MNKYLEKIKEKALTYAFIGLSLFGNPSKSLAQSDENNSSMINVIHSSSVSQNDKMRSYSESLSMQHNDKSYLMSNIVIIEDIGQGYSVIQESYSLNDKQKTDRTILSPDGRLINIDFYNEKDFMFPSELIVRDTPFVKNGKEPLNSSDPQVIKKHNDNWENKQRINAMKKIKNPQDREAFYRFVKMSREMLEHTEFPKKLDGFRMTSYTEDYSNSSTNLSQNSKDLRKMYKEIKKHMQSSPENLREKALKGDTTQTARLDYLWLKNQAKE